MQSLDPWTGRIGALAGVAFALLLFFSTAMLDTPRSATDQELLDWWSDDANLTTVIVSTYLQIAASMALIVFLAVSRSVLTRAEGAAGIATTVAFAAGIALAGAILANDGARGAVAFGVKMNDEALPGADILRFFPQLGYVLLGPVAGIASGAMIAATSISALRSGVVVTWVGVLGLGAAAGCAVLALAVGPFFIPVLLVWMLVASVILWRATSLRAPAALRPEPVGA